MEVKEVETATKFYISSACCGACGSLMKYWLNEPPGKPPALTCENEGCAEYGKKYEAPWFTMVPVKWRLCT
jgi:hypothetical protein